ncbi:MAG: SIS domain-containing protein [Candidatus Altiarchaeota archaeon]
MDYVEYAQRYFRDLKGALDALPAGDVREVVEILAKARDEGRCVFVFGNGGSAATASHFANDLAKGAIRGKDKRFKAVCLADNVPLMLAWGNDTDFSKIFAEQLKNLLSPGDVVIGISGSGNSKNVLAAIEYANENGATTIGFTGMGGGRLKDAAEHSIVVSSNHMGRVEDVHLILAHVVAYYLKEK